jgi:hypothetical protein
LPVLVFLTAIWKIFINTNFFYHRLKPTQLDRVKRVFPFKKLNYVVFLKWVLVVIMFFILLLLTWHTTSHTFLWNHLSCSNFKYWMFFLLVFCGLIFFTYLRFVAYANVPVSIDFCFALANLIAIIPIIYYINTLYSLLFLIEAVSATLFYKFVVSKIWYAELASQWDPKSKVFDRQLPTKFLDMLFFQFWATFFSTVLILTSTLIFFYIFNTSEWTIMYYLFQINSNRVYFDNTLTFTFLCTPLLIGIFLKLGLSPLHLYKIEVYQGLPFKTIFFYTTYFFLCFVNYFCFFLIFLFNYTSIYWNFTLIIFFFGGLIYTVSLLFDVQFVKAFFAYSTIVNVVFSILLVLVYNNFA